MNTSKAIAAGVTAALVPISATPPQAAASIVYTHSDLIAPGDHTQFVTLVNADLHRPPRVLFSWGGFKLASGPQDTNAAASDPPDFDRYCLVGLDSAGGVFVSFADPSAALGQSFSTVFPGLSEAQVADAIVNGGSAFDNFMSVISTTPGAVAPMGVQCSCVHFSDGAAYGTFVADFNPVPAPATLLVTFAGPIFLLRRRRTPTPT
jgi:hypothetical protein